MKKIAFCTLLVATFLYSACDTINTNTEDKPLELLPSLLKKADADNVVALKIFNKIQKENSFFSPMSLHIALGMLYNGTAGDTRTELANAIGLGHLSEQDINEYYQLTINLLQQADPLTTLHIANSIWYRKDFWVKQDFIDVNKKYFDAHVAALDFNIPEARDTINAWCAKKTNNTIPSIIDAPISADVMMYLINALYFKSVWKYQFDVEKTYKALFTKSDNSQDTVSMMMHESINLPFYQDATLSYAEIPYNNDAYSMLIFLPSEDKSIDDIIPYIEEKTWDVIISNLQESKILLGLPRFKAESTIDLNSPLQNIGINRIFLGGLQNISDDKIAVTKITQKTYIDVNEQGTEAAGVTSVEIEVTGELTHNSLYANRPFLYVIHEKTTSAIVFIGRMDNPAH